MIIVPSAYLPSIGYFMEIVRAENDNTIVVDQAEHYVKRTLRNRAHIITAQGVMPLTVPVRNANRLRQPMLSVEIDNSKRWQHQHWIAIKSAYQSSPYYEHYAPHIEPLYRREWSRLVDLNNALTDIILKLLSHGRRGGAPLSKPQIANEYIEPQALNPSEDLDLRSKEALSLEALAQRNRSLPQYMQVFEDRIPFTPNASILDLLFCEGPQALALLLGRL